MLRRVAVILGLAGPAALYAADGMQENVSRLVGAALVSDVAYARLQFLSDRIGNRLSGSAALDKAIAWSLGEFANDGFSDVHAESVMVPVWVRGEEHCTLLEPYVKDLPMLGLGMSVGTPPEGIEAEVVAATSFEELDAMGEAKVRGKIVVWDVPFTTYGGTVRFRGRGSDAASKLGGVASLVRSVGPVSLVTPHTGSLRYEKKVPRVPGAAITAEDATLIHRLLDVGEKVRVRLAMSADTLPDAMSANVVADIPGREKPEEIVLLCGHLDTWDVGQGAQDDGAGCLIAWEAARLIHSLGLRPRRTIRVVLYTNEENGVRGGEAYLKAHRDEVRNHAAAIESDSGNGPAAGFTFDIRAAGEEDTTKTEVRTKLAARTDEGLRMLREAADWLSALGAKRIVSGGSGTDIGALAKEGVPCLGLDHDTTKYFEIHHTHADTFEKIDKNALNRNVAIMAVMAYLLAEMPGRLPSYLD